MRRTATAYVDLRTNERPLRTKSVKADIIKCDVISGAEITEEHEWPGSMIPFIRVVGTDVQVENERVIKGLVRNAMDAQAMYNSGRRATPSMWRLLEGAIHRAEGLCGRLGRCLADGQRYAPCLPWNTTR